MHVLIIVVIVLGLLGAGLYHWLSGHWFARVVAFLVFGLVLSLVVAALARSEPTVPVGAGLFIGAILGLPLAWFVASLPLYLHRARERALWHSLSQMSYADLDRCRAAAGPNDHRLLAAIRQREEEKDRKLLSQEPVGF